MCSRPSKALGLSCPVVVVTSDKCYENREWEFAYRENDPLGGHDVYSMSKAATELVAQSWHRVVLHLRTPSSVRWQPFGPAMSSAAGITPLDRIVPDCIRALIEGKPILVRNPAAVRPWQHVLECLSGYLWLGSPAGGRGEAFPAGNGLSISARSRFARQPVKRLVEEILTVWPGQWVDGSDPDSLHEATLLSLAIDKAARTARLAPSVGFPPGHPPDHDLVSPAARLKNGDMLGFSRRQIEHYAESARAKEIAWANCRMNFPFQCRSCGSTDGALILDLGTPAARQQPPAAPRICPKPEPKFPLRLAVCESCWLLQILDLVPPVQLFSEYLYFSSFSDLMLRHAQARR